MCSLSAVKLFTKKKIMIELMKGERGIEGNNWKGYKGKLLMKG